MPIVMAVAGIVSRSHTEPHESPEPRFPESEAVNTQGVVTHVVAFGTWVDKLVSFLAHLPPPGEL